MNETTPLYYLQWDEKRQTVQEEVQELLVSTGVLFLRKLVNATFIHNEIWEHSSHETNDEGEAIIYVLPWLTANVKHGEEMKTAVLAHFERSEQYGIEFYTYNGKQFDRLCTLSYHNALDAAQVLLDHYRSVEGTYYFLSYAILDPSRRKVLIFLDTGEQENER